MRSNSDKYASGGGTWRGAKLTHTNNYISKHGADRSNITDHYQYRLSCKYDDHKFLKMNMLYS